MATLILSFQALGWGSKGHMMVAQIAKKCLDKSVVDSVQFYLGKMSFKKASVWMDEIKRDKTFDHMKPWHYINVERDATYVKTQEPNVVNQLEMAISILRNKNKSDVEKTALALRILFHLIGDLHQPLHAGYGEDKGGNKIDVDFFGRASNLHKVWDYEIIEKSKIKLKDCYALANSLSDEEKKKIQKVNVEAWMNESRGFLPSVYSFENKIIDQNYIDKNKVIIEKQLVKAGVRLAVILHEAFKK